MTTIREDKLEQRQKEFKDQELVRKKKTIGVALLSLQCESQKTTNIQLDKIIVYSTW